MNSYLRQARLSAGLTQQQLAILLGTSALSVWRWEQGMLPTPVLRQRLCAFFQKNEAELGFVHQQATTLFTHASLPAYFDPAIPSLLTPLIGRDSLLSQLKQCMTQTRGMLSLSGLPGIGKTAIVQALAADPEVQQTFSDGILWMSLEKEGSLSQQFARWTAFLQHATEPGQPAQPLDEQALRVLWGEQLRKIIGTRRLLLVFDDIWSMEDLLACQVAGPQCTVLFTTRFPKIARCATHTYHVDELSEEASLALLASHVPHVVDQKPGAVHRLVQVVEGHPLALALLGLALRIENHTGQIRRMQASLDRLLQPSERLHLAFPNASLTTPALSLFSTIAASDHMLTQEARDALRELAQQPFARTLFREELAIAAHISLQALDQLSDAGLLEITDDGRYRLHPVIADYARVLSAQARQTETKPCP
jgi:transcriptional regulator with XRE-family HTH domain